MGADQGRKYGKKLTGHRKALIEIYKKIPATGEKPCFLMPLSLRLIKEAGESGIEWRGIHMVDFLSMIYAARIDRARDYLRQKKRERWREKGIAEVRKATAEEFDQL